MTLLRKSTPRLRRGQAGSYVYFGIAVAFVGLTGFGLARIGNRSARGSFLSVHPLVRRTMVPDLHAALEGVLKARGGAGATVAVLDCGDARWASVWPSKMVAKAPVVAVREVKCIDFSGPPDAGDDAQQAAPGQADAADAPLSSQSTDAPSPSVPWLQQQSLVHVPHSPRGGAASASTTLTIFAGRKGGGRAHPSSKHTPLPSTILALANPDGNGVPARYVPYVASAMGRGSKSALVLLDAGNVASKGDKPPTKKPRAPGFQVITALDTPDATHQFYQLAINTVQSTFSRVYETRLWGNDGGGSGTGSSLAATVSLRASLADLIAKYGIKTLLDSSCGSMHWMPLVAKAAHEADPTFRFTGTDAVCSLIDGHRAAFAAEAAWMDFACVDASHEPLPRGYDLIFSRDSLQHLPIASAYKFLHNVRQSGAKYLLVGSYLTGGQLVTGGRNEDIAAGDVYDIDLTKPPFNVRPAPLEVIKEDNPERKFMLLLDVAHMTWDEDLALT